MVIFLTLSRLNIFKFLLAIPIALDKKDLIAIAKTGSGKTLAFMLPGIQSIIEEKQYIQTQGLVIFPFLKNDKH